MNQESSVDRPEQIRLDIDEEKNEADEASDLPRPDLSPNHYLNWSNEEIMQERENYDAYEDLGGMPVKYSAEVEEE